MLSCGGGSTSTLPPKPPPGFVLQSINVADGPPSSVTPSPTSTPKGPTPTMTPRPAATSTSVPGSVPTGGAVNFNAQGDYLKSKDVHRILDITLDPNTLWASSNQSALVPPTPGNGGIYTTAAPGCTCIAASSSGIISQFVGVGVYVDVATCPACAVASSSSAEHSLDTAAFTASIQNAGILKWTFNAGSPPAGAIAIASNGSIYFVASDGLLHGLDSNGKEILHQTAAGNGVVLLADGTVVAKSSPLELSAFGTDGRVRWHTEIGPGDGPIASNDSAIYASSGSDLLSFTISGSPNWKVNVGKIASAVATPDGIVIGVLDGSITSLAADGAAAWTFAPTGGFSGALAFADDVIYAGSASGAIYALDSRTGKESWHVSTRRRVIAGPAVSPAGVVFFGSDAVYGVSSDGQIKWTQAASKPGSNPMSAVGTDGVFGVDSADIGAMLGGDGNFIWSSGSFGKVAAIAASPDGTLYVGNADGRIYAVK